MAENNGGSAGDTLEFLKIMGMAPASPEPAAPAARPAPAVPSQPAPDRRQIPDPDKTVQVPAPGRARRTSPADTFSGMVAVATPVSSPLPPEEEPKPVVIKGGPRRVVRADGRQPQMDHALGQRRFALSSGHEMFVQKKGRNRVRETLVAAGILLALVILFAVVWQLGAASIQRDKQQDVVGATAYDGALSLTPADDGGYYTAFLVTSTDTNEDVIGNLDQIVLYRYDKDVTTALRVAVPTNLYTRTGSGDAAQVRTIQALLADTQSITSALSAIEDAFGARLYNVVCCDADTYARLTAVMGGQASASSIDPQSLLGNVRTNLTLEALVELCGKFGALDQATVRDLTAPVTGLDVNGTVMSQGDPTTYRTYIVAMASVPANAQYDANGNLAGTQYDENGNPLLDANGLPQGALIVDGGALLFDENGNLQFYGQQYDANGNPVGTIYDEWGNMLYDEWGNPLGTQYDENGNFIYDWRGNMVIVNG